MLYRWVGDQTKDVNELQRSRAALSKKPEPEPRMVLEFNHMNSTKSIECTYFMQIPTDTLLDYNLWPKEQSKTEKKNRPSKTKRTV